MKHRSNSVSPFGVVNSDTKDACCPVHNVHLRVIGYINRIGTQINTCGTCQVQVIN